MMLEVEGLSVSYGKHRALEGARLHVGKGEIVVILGANGAGKTTLLKAICGVSEGKVAGHVRMDGVEIDGMPAHRIVEEGIALVPEGRGIFGDMTVEDNLTLGAYADRARSEEAGNLERVYRLFPKLMERRRQVARTMSGGEQQMVAIGRAMMSNPAILALDEPSLGLSPLLCKDLFHSLGTVRKAGLGMLLVEQNARQSLAIADRGYLLENGRIVHQDKAEALLTDPAVQKAYLGGAAARTVTRGASANGARLPVSPVARASIAATEPTPQNPAVSSTDIAAAAMHSMSRRGTAPAHRPSPNPAPGPTPEPRPRPQPAPAPEPQPPRPASNGTIRARDVLGGVDISDLVSRANTKSDRRAPQTNGSGRLPSKPQAPKPPSTPDIPMPDLTSSANRLQSILTEIEGAARRAEVYRPTPPKRR